MAHGLYEVAIDYVAARMRIERDRDAIAWWTMREMECHAQAALSHSANADDHWAACQSVASRYLTGKASDLGENNVDANKAASDSRWLWIAWQLARCDLLKAQGSLATYLAAPANAAQREKTLELVRRIVKKASELTADILRRQALAARQAEGREAPPEHLRSLAADVQLLACEALLLQSQLYPPETKDRVAALTEASTLVQDVLAKTDDNTPKRDAMRLVQAIAQLELGDSSAIVALDQLANGSEDTQVRVLAGIRSALALAKRGQDSRVRSTLDNLQQLAHSDPRVAPQWILAKIEIELINIGKLGDQAKQKTLRELAELSKQLGAHYGDYWRTRAEALLVNKLSSSQLADTAIATDLLMAEVRQLTAAGNFSEAANKLLLARDSQVQSNHAAMAIDFAAKAAALLRHEQKWQQAADALESTSEKFPREVAASDSHLWAIRSYAQWLRAEPASLQAKAAYEFALSQHLRLWPDDAATSEIIAWTRNWFNGQNQGQTYVELLIDSAYAAANLEAGDILLVECFEQLMLLPQAQRLELLTKKLASEPSETIDATGNDEVRAAIPIAWQACQTLSLGVGQANWSDVATLRSQLDRFDQWLSFPSADRFALRNIVALARSVDTIRLAQVPQIDAKYNLNSLSPLCRAVVVPALVEAIDSMESENQQAVLRALQLRSDWATIDLAEISLIEQTALARLGIWLEDGNAEEKLNAIADANPSNGEIQLLAAYHLLSRGSAKDALQRATRIAAFSQRGSPLNLAARWCMIRCLLRADEKAAAQKAAKLILATHSELSELWLKRFRATADN